MGLNVRTAMLAAVVLGAIVPGAVLPGAHAWAQSPGEMVGTWATEDGRAKIRMQRCTEAGDRMCGFVVWMKDPLNDKGQPRTDFRNPDPAKRGRPSLGLELMSNLKPEDEGHYAGEIYNADDGKMYSVTLSVESPTELKVKGCLLHFLCGSQSWARVADLPVPEPTTMASSAAAKVVKPASAHAHDNQPKP